jgi:uncharacterized protein (DUF362 family)
MREAAVSKGDEMNSTFSRRELFQASALGALALSAAAKRAIAQAPAPLVSSLAGDTTRSAVSLIKGDDRRNNVYQALMAIDHQLAPQLKRKQYVVIKPNNVSTNVQLASTHNDALRGILDYVSERFHGPVVIAESSAGNTLEGFESFGYSKLVAEYKKRKLSLVDLNTEGRYETLPVLDHDLHLTDVRLAARLLDPEAFVFCAAMLKTHNTVVATLSVKNMCLGAPLHHSPKETVRWNDKRKYHVGVRQTHYNMMLTAQRMKPYWGATVIDGFEGMEGKGPAGGTPVPSRIAIASTDYVAADRVGIEAMGIKAGNIGYLLYCWQAGVGQYDLNKIDVIGENLASVRRNYSLHPDINKELQWMGPMEVVPEILG